MKSLSHRTFNNLLSVVVAAVGLYIALSPFLPVLTFYLRDSSAEAKAPYAGELASREGSDTDAALPEDNRIVIPSINIDEPIREGSNIGVITDGGTWRRPNTSLPTENNNSVIIGHRWYGSEVSTFYHLDKVVVGDLVAVYWEGEEIMYEVVEVKVVEATEVDIEAPTDEKQLTIYTCDPVWTAKNRLVVTAKPLTNGEVSL